MLRIIYITPSSLHSSVTLRLLLMIMLNALGKVPHLMLWYTFIGEA
jgi:hypothetical protein